MYAAFYSFSVQTDDYQPQIKLGDYNILKVLHR